MNVYLNSGNLINIPIRATSIFAAVQGRPEDE
jgi:hypothetical protein